MHSGDGPTVNLWGFHASLVKASLQCLVRQEQKAPVQRLEGVKEKTLRLQDKDLSSFYRTLPDDWLKLTAPPTSTLRKITLTEKDCKIDGW